MIEYYSTILPENIEKSDVLWWWSFRRNLLVTKQFLWKQVCWFPQRLFSIYCLFQERHSPAGETDHLDGHLVLPNATPGQVRKQHRRSNFFSVSSMLQSSSCNISYSTVPDMGIASNRRSPITDSYEHVLANKIKLWEDLTKDKQHEHV